MMKIRDEIKNSKYNAVGQATQQQQTAFNPHNHINPPKSWFR